MRPTLALLVLALIFVASASAAGPSVAWTKKDMTTAIRAIGYPKPHPKKLSCKGQGTAVDGRYASFRCLTTYRHHRRSRFAIAGQGEGGWLCAGKTATACKLLRHGFLTASAAAVYPSMAGAAQITAEGYLQDTGRFPFQVVHFCEQTGASTFSCPFTANAASVTVTVTLKQVTGGYVESAMVSQ